MPENGERLRELDDLGRMVDELDLNDESFDDVLERVVERGFAGEPPVWVVLLRISELIVASRFETSRRCSVVASPAFRNRLRKSLTFRA